MKVLLPYAVAVDKLTHISLVHELAFYAEVVVADWHEKCHYR